MYGLVKEETIANQEQRGGTRRGGTDVVPTWSTRRRYQTRWYQTEADVEVQMEAKYTMEVKSKTQKKEKIFFYPLGL